MSERIAVLLNKDGTPVRKEGVIVFAPMTLRRTAHVSDNQVDVFHCAFCGSGGIVARGDGSIECSFCNSAFTVTVSPLYPAFPQSVNGQPYPWPGRPDGGVDPSMMGPIGGDPSAAAGGSGFGGKLIPGNGGGDDADPDGDGDSDGPPWAKGSDDEGDSSSDDSSDDGDGDEATVGGKKKPPFGKKSYLTVTGARLPEDEYIRHLAIATAADPNAVAARIREERRMEPRRRNHAPFDLSERRVQ